MNKKLSIAIALILGGIILAKVADLALISALKLLAYPIMLVGIIFIPLGLRDRRRAAEASLREDALYRAEDEGMNSEIAKLQRVSSLLKLIIGICYAATVICFFVSVVSDNFVPLFAASIVTVVFIGIRSTRRRRLKEYVSENIAREALESVFEVEEYDPFGYIRSDRVGADNFGIGRYDHVGGGDYVRGSYKGLAIEMCDMHLTRRESRTDENGHREDYDEDVFRGFWLICDFAKELAADIRLWERDRLDKLLGGEGIVTDNEDFNKAFHVESEIAEEAFYILTPHMMEYILEMNKKTGGRTHMRFERGGRVTIAVSTGRNAFEAGKTQNATLLRKQFIEEIRYITDIIDELRLVDTLYKEG